MYEIVIICNAKAIVKQNENDIMKITKEGYYYKCEIITKIFLKKGKKKKKDRFKNMSEEEKQKLKEYARMYCEQRKMLL